MKIRIIGSLAESGRLPIPFALSGRVLNDKENRQMSEPVRIGTRNESETDLITEYLTGGGTQMWAFRNRIVQVDDATCGHDEIITRVKHKVLDEEKAFDKLKREVEMFEKFEKASTVNREPIPADVRLFVWRRDQGRCVQCGSNEKLEYDHIIPLAKGGSNTERNIQLLCETCNRSKGTAKWTITVTRNSRWRCVKPKSASLATRLMLTLSNVWIARVFVRHSSSSRMRGCGPERPPPREPTT